MMHSNLLGALAMVCALASSGCRLLVELAIDEENTTSPDGGPLVGDADTIDAVDAVDAAEDGSTEACQRWGFSPEEIDPCLIPEPGADLALTSGVWTYDTGDGSLTDPDSNVHNPPSSVETFANGEALRILSIESLTVPVGGTLRATGQYPLAIVVWDSALIDGTIDVSSSSTSVGAGSNPTRCPVSQPAGVDAANGSGGGAGGSLGSSGGSGGSGNLGASLGGTPGVEAAPALLQGGCDGSTGGNTLGGGAGAGGGAVAIIALQDISITGLVHAGGAGGGGSTGGRSGGGGGGSGGVIHLESPEIILAESAALAANGGGGGGGSDNMVAGPGGDGLPEATAATAGIKEGRGADGGAGSTPAGDAGADGVDAERGGGGGGGGAGVILLRSSAVDSPQGVVISPPPSS